MEGGQIFPGSSAGEVVIYLYLFAYTIDSVENDKDAISDFLPILVYFPIFQKKFPKNY